MDGPPGYTVWLPVVVTVVGLFLLVFGLARFVSNMWADLLGLFYLLASPLIYRFLRSRVSGRDAEPTPPETGPGPGMPVGDRRLASGRR